MVRPCFLYKVVYRMNSPDAPDICPVAFWTFKALSKRLRDNSFTIITAELRFCSDADLIESAQADEQVLLSR